jgi:hypothetical protein
MRALADAAADDPGVEEAYAAIVEGFVQATARHIEDETAIGRILPVDAHETAKALVWMMERYLNLSFGREPASAPEAVSDTLATIWTRVLYGVSDGSGGGG